MAKRRLADWSMLLQFLDTLRNDRVARWSVGAILVSNLIIIGGHVATEALRFLDLFTDKAWVESQPFSLSREGGNAEVFNYVQTALCVALLATIFVRTQTRVFAFWAFVYLLVMADDAAMLHERGGEFLVANFSALPSQSALPAHLRVQDLGELAAWSGMALLVAMAWTWMRLDPGPPAARAFGRLFLYAFAALVAFGIGADMLHSAFSQIHWLERALTLVEDGGEMLAIAVACSLAILICRGRTCRE